MEKQQFVGFYKTPDGEQNKRNTTNECDDWIFDGFNGTCGRNVKKDV